MARVIRVLEDGNRIMVNDRTNATWIEPPAPNPSKRVVGSIVNTEAELEALPAETVIVGAGDKFDNEYSDRDWCPWQKDTFGVWRSWQYVDGFSSLQLVTVKFLPAKYTVVWVPSAEKV